MSKIDAHCTREATLASKFCLARSCIEQTRKLWPLYCWWPANEQCTIFLELDAFNAWMTSEVQTRSTCHCRRVVECLYLWDSICGDVGCNHVGCSHVGGGVVPISRACLLKASGMAMAEARICLGVAGNPWCVSSLLCSMSTLSRLVPSSSRSELDSSSQWSIMLINIGMNPMHKLATCYMARLLRLACSRQRLCLHLCSGKSIQNLALSSCQTMSVSVRLLPCLQLDEANTKS